MRVAKQTSPWPSLGLVIGVCGSVVLINLAARAMGGFAWWANFVLLAGLGLLGARPFVQGTELMWKAVLSDLLVSTGILTLVLGVTLLLELYQLVWMLMLLVSGGAVVAQSLTFMGRTSSPAERAWAQTLLWAGGIAATLGLAFLAAHWHMLRFPPWLVEARWWGLVTILIGLGAYGNANQAAPRTQADMVAAPRLARVGLAIIILGVVSMLSPW